MTKTPNETLPDDREVEVRSGTATVHRYYVEVVTNIECKGTPSRLTEAHKRVERTPPCDNNDFWFKQRVSDYRSVMEHVQQTGHEVIFRMVDYCSAMPTGYSLAPDAANFRELRKTWGDLRG